MSDRRVGGVRRVEAYEPLLEGELFDYTDAFVADGLSGALENPREWMNSRLMLGSGVSKSLTRRLGLTPRPPGGLRGWRIRAATPDFIHLEYDLALMDVTVVARNLSPSSRMVSTGLRYRRPLLARAAWFVVGPVHRLLSRRLVSGG